MKLLVRNMLYTESYNMSKTYRKECSHFIIPIEEVFFFHSYVHDVLCALNTNTTFWNFTIKPLVIEKLNFPRK